MSTSIPKIYRLGERLTQGIFDGGPVVIEEKIDGSQFSFGMRDNLLWCRSKTTLINECSSGMFSKAVKTAQRLILASKLVSGWEYQCEYLAKPKHNVLAYDRVPAGNLVLFDVRMKDGNYLVGTEAKKAIALLLGLEPVSCFHDGPLSEFDSAGLITNFLAHKSVLGGQFVEGVVVKNYGKQHGERPEHPLTAKVVSERFKERMASRPLKIKSDQNDSVQAIVNSLRTEARWVKAVGHLRDAGALTDSNQDIGPLIKELQRDLLEEETDWIKEKLFEAFIKQISNGVVQGFAQWYQKLVAAGGLSAYQSQLTEQKQIEKQNEQTS